MIHFLKAPASRFHRHRYVDFGDLDDATVSLLLEVTKVKLKATMAAVTFPEGSKCKVESWGNFVRPQDFMSHDMKSAKVSAMKGLEPSILDTIEARAIARIADLEKKAADLEKKLADAEAGKYTPAHTLCTLSQLRVRQEKRVARHTECLKNFQAFRATLDT